MGVLKRGIVVRVGFMSLSMWVRECTTEMEERQGKQDKAENKAVRKQESDSYIYNFNQYDT